MKGELSPLWGEDGRKDEAVVLGFILVIIAVRLFYASALALTADEAYYWQWSRHLAPGYYDHPPMIAYVIAAGTWIAGINPLGVRLLPTIMSGGMAWMVYRMTLKMNFRREAGLWALALAIFTPIFNVGAVLSTPDSPFVFFWTASIWCAQIAINSSRTRDWVGAGLLMGLGMLSKFPMILLPASMLIAMVSTVKGRSALRSPGPWLGALAGAILCLPYIVWSFTGGWNSVFYQLGHGIESSSGGFSINLFFLFIAGQLGVTGFLIFPIVLMALFQGMRGWLAKEKSEVQRTMLALLTAPALLTLLVFGAASFLRKSGPNWPAAMYPTSFVLTGMLVSKWKSKGKVFALTAITLVALLSIYIQVETVRPLVAYQPKGFFSKVQNRDEFARWAEETRNTRGEEGKSARILADSYQLASLLAFYLPDHPETDSPGETGSGSEYLRWKRGWEEGESAWFFTTEDQVPGYFSRLETVGTLTESRLGWEVRTILAKFGRLKAYQPDGR